MSGPAPDLNRAIALHQQGRLDDAERIYRRLLQAKPRDASVRQLLGLVAYQRGNLKEAAEMIEAAIRLNAGVADFHNNLGEVYRGLNRTADAAKCYRRALRLNPSYAHAHNNLGLVEEALGNRAAARSSYEAALRLAPGYAEAWNNLGLLEQAEGNLPAAVARFEQAIAAQPAFAAGYGMLGQALSQLGRKTEALAALRQAIQLRPDYADAYYNLGLVLGETKKFGEAAAGFEKAVSLRPDFAEAYNNWGNVLNELKQPEAAAQKLAEALRLKPEMPEVHNNLGLSAKVTGRLDEAFEHFNRALALKPAYAEAFNNRGLVWQAKGNNDAAIDDYEKSLEVQPTYGPALNNLGCLYMEIGRFTAARTVFERALATEPDAPVTRLNLASLLIFEGRADEAVAVYDGLHGTLVDRPALGSNLLYAVTCASRYSPAEIGARHRNWLERYAAGQARFPLPSGSRDHGRLRVGYVSADFIDHAVARFLLPLLAGHDRKRFEIFVYTDATIVDDMARTFAATVEHWRAAAGWNDQQLGEKIMADEIDILIDLSGHTAKNRMQLFARRPAPLQVSYLGYPNTTGLPTMDYRLVDRWSDPEGLTDPFYTEKLWRLPDSAWCYRPPSGLPEPTASPRLAGGGINFGSFNNLTKLSPRTVELWAEILRLASEAKLVLKARGLVDEGMRQQIWARFEREGVTADRLQFSPWTRTVRDHFDYYRHVDLALETFPYHGTTTTCDALYMGVPVLTLAGEMHHSRVGVSLLTNVGLPELVARSADEFVRRAVELAGAPAKLAEMRKGLRARMVSSPLMNEAQFARQFEDALEAMWARRE